MTNSKNTIDDVTTLRRDYLQKTLHEGDLPQNPMDALSLWLTDAIHLDATDANAMTLSTMSLEGYPTSRIVLARGISQSGVRFFTNYNSSKGLEIEQNQKVSASFFWQQLERQIRIQGTISKISAKESDDYFSSRPRESQIGAWASPQSKIIKNREELEISFQKFAKQFENTKVIPRPPHWGGYQIFPIKVEFWQGRTSRLHDRLEAHLQNEQWHWQRLAP
ncbi:MAG: pyridoxamine 5'-phosphate oxidase [Proteobacteria bacterium]|nr:pyridoxamine 5'-phosphate oxidase [Pseudomonadota bacterium]